MGSCDNASCSNDGTKRCVRCHHGVYCSEECQRICWSAHRKICKKSVKFGMKLLSIMFKDGGVCDPWSYIIREGQINHQAFNDMIGNEVEVYAELRPETYEVRSTFAASDMRIVLLTLCCSHR